MLALGTRLQRFPVSLALAVILWPQSRQRLLANQYKGVRIDSGMDGLHIVGIPTSVIAV